MNTGAMKTSETQWMAYVDGELDAAGIAEVEAAMHEDPEFAAMVRAQQALRAHLQAAWAPVLDEPVPDRLAGVLRAPPRSRQAPVWLAAAASLVLGVLAASWWQSAPRDDMQWRDGNLQAGGELAHALQDRLTSDPGRSGVAVGLSFRDRDGDFCRSFVLEARSTAGLACRRDAGWQVVTLGTTRTQRGTLRQAASALPPAVLAEIDARVQGEPLDAEAERSARAAGWR